jgi:hypothetical protein
MKPFRLIVVDGMFTITGRGIIVTPSLPAGKMTLYGGEVRTGASADSDIRIVRTGDNVELRRPDGTILSSIMAINHLKPLAGGSEWGLSLPNSVPPDDVPIGTEIWWISAGKK